MGTEDIFQLTTEHCKIANDLYCIFSEKSRNLSFFSSPSINQWHDHIFRLFQQLQSCQQSIFCASYWQEVFLTLWIAGQFHLKWQIFFFLIPFWRQPNWKKFITRLLFVTCHSEANKTLFIFFNPSHSGSKNRSRGRSNWNNTYCLLPFTADLISVLPPCTRAKYTAYLGFYLVAAQKNCVEIKMAWVPRQ